MVFENIVFVGSHLLRVYRVTIDAQRSQTHCYAVFSFRLQEPGGKNYGAHRGNGQQGQWNMLYFYTNMYTYKTFFVLIDSPRINYARFSVLKLFAPVEPSIAFIFCQG